MTTTRLLLVDDEAVARRRMRRYLAGAPGLSIVGECADGAAALAAIRSLRPDIVLLDVQMPELDGLGVLQALTPGERPAIIFVTAYDRYALQAFDHHAIDYLLKPFTRERFLLALSRAQERLQARRGDERLSLLLDELRSARQPAGRVAVRSRNRIVLIDWADVDWIEAADNYVKIHAGKAEYLLRQTLARLEQELDGRRFVRVHRSAIVQIDRITELIPESHGDITLKLRGGADVMLSRTFRNRVEQRLGAIFPR